MMRWVAASMMLAAAAACSKTPDAKTSPAPARAAVIVAEDIVIENEGWLLKGTLRRPETRAVKPAALLLHRAAGHRGEYVDVAEALADRGVASLALDLRGHGESDTLGRFEEPYRENLHINEGAYRDVAAALDWLAARTDIDAERLVVVGASYSGEAAGRALREGARPAAAYVMMSPGNFSNESIAAAKDSGARWLFVRSVEEGPASKPHIDALFDALETDAPSIERRVLEGSGHATELLDGRPEFVVELSLWIAEALQEAP